MKRTAVDAVCVGLCVRARSVLTRLCCTYLGRLYCLRHEWVLVSWL